MPGTLSRHPWYEVGSLTSVTAGIDSVPYREPAKKEAMMRSETMWMWTALALGAVSIVLFGFALAELTNGIRDVPRHWWSALPVLGMAAAMGLLYVARFRSEDRE